MTHNDGFDRTVSDWLDEQAGRGTPGYLDEVLTRTTRTRQRPAWSSLERWLPVQSTLRLAPIPRNAWVVLIVVGLLLALGAAALAIGSRPRPLPAPFGLAANGMILYGTTNGDIYALDTATNVSRPVVTGATIDSAPVFSPDGTKFVFGRIQPGLEPISTMVANVDGTDVRPLTDRLSLSWFDSIEWSDDGSKVLVVGLIDGQDGLWTIGLDGVHRLIVASTGPTIDQIEAPHWRPNGTEIVFVGRSESLGTSGLYVIGTDGSPARAIVEPTAAGPAEPALSPDGTQVAYSQGTPGQRTLRVVGVDSGEPRTIAYADSPDDVAPHWSPSGTELLFRRHSGDTYRLAVGSVAGGPVTLIGPTRSDKNGESDARFAPDGTKVLAYYDSDRSSWILSTHDGTETQLTGQSSAPWSWQRR